MREGIYQDKKCVCDFFFLENKYFWKLKWKRFWGFFAHNMRQCIHHSKLCGEESWKINSTSLFLQGIRLLDLASVIRNHKQKIVVINKLLMLFELNFEINFFLNPLHYLIHYSIHYSENIRYMWMII